MMLREPAWWTAAREIVAGLSNPRADAAASDDGIERLAGGSAIVAALRSLFERVGRARTESRAAAALAPHMATWRTLDAPTRLRTGAWTLAIAALVALVGHVIRPDSVGPLGWLLPMAALLAALGIAACAGPIARWTGENVS
jgi:hypothetical protein